MKHFKNLKKHLPHIALPPIHKPRLDGWRLTALLLFVVTGCVSPQQPPVFIYQLALLTLAAVLGYWLDLSLFPKSRPSQYLRHEHKLMVDGRYPGQSGNHRVFSVVLLRRAIIVSAMSLTVTMGL